MDANTQLGFKSKVFAALAYLILFLGWIGLLVDIIGYFVMKERYVKFHSGQAFLTGLILTIVGLILAVIFFGEFVNSPFAIPMDITYSVINILYAFYALTAIIYIGCALLALGGKEFRIPIISKFLSK
jgi:uncharacterized membrane protein